MLARGSKKYTSQHVSWDTRKFGTLRDGGDLARPGLARAIRPLLVGSGGAASSRHDSNEPRPPPFVKAVDNEGKTTSRLAHEYNAPRVVKLLEDWSRRRQRLELPTPDMPERRASKDSFASSSAGSSEDDDEIFEKNFNARLMARRSVV